MRAQARAGFTPDLIHTSRYDFINQHFWIGWVKRDQWVSTLKDLKDILSSPFSPVRGRPCANPGSQSPAE